MKEEIMKALKRCVFLASFLFLTVIQVYAHEGSSQKIFPDSMGMIGEIKGKAINIRSYPNLYAKVVTQLNNSTVYILGQNSDWYKINLQGKEGWVYKKYVQVARSQNIPYSKVLGDEVVDYCKQFIGTPYVWGGSDLRRGVDCSGLTQEIYKTFDIDISRVSYMQALDGRRITKSELMPGDLVFFDTSGNNRGNISHVGIYVGNDKFVHADGTKGVMISSLNSTYYKKNYVASTRVLLS